jgi:hypothetical protein
MSKSNLYQQLVDFTNGVISAEEIEDPNIKIVKTNGLVKLDFDTDDYIEILVGDGSNEYYYLKEAIGAYYGYTGSFMYDDWRSREDWDEGYMVEGLDQENIDRVMEIVNMLGFPHDPTSVDFGKISKFLHDNFERQVDDIIGEYQTMTDDAMKEVISNFAYDEYCNVFFRFNIFHSSAKNLCFKTYTTSVKNLISLYKSHGKYDWSLKQLLRQISKDNDLAEDDLFDIAMEQYWRHFDKKYFKNYVKGKLEEIKEKIEEDAEHIDEYREITDRLKKFKYGTWYDLPKNDHIMFKINFVSLKTLDINFAYKKKGTNQITDDINMDLERFLLFLYQPELF